jgi:hypothetical protein
MEYEGFKNYSTWNLALTIDNDQEIQATMLKGLEICAKRFLGFSPKASSHPFITMDAPLRNQAVDSVIVINQAKVDKALKAGHATAATYVFGMSSSGNSLASMAKLGFDENFKAAEVDGKQIIEHFLSKHWENTLEKVGKVKKKVREDEGLDL